MSCRRGWLSCARVGSAAVIVSRSSGSSLLCFIFLSVFSAKILNINKLCKFFPRKLFDLRGNEGTKGRGDEKTFCSRRNIVKCNLAPSPSRPHALSHLCLLNHPLACNTACLTTPSPCIYACLTTPGPMLLLNHPLALHFRLLNHP